MKAVSRLTDAELQAEYDALQDDEGELSEDQSRRFEALDREIDARGEWNHPDARVREAAGNYR